MPLAYIIHDHAAVKPKADDLPANYNTLENEIIARMPHQDNAGTDLPTYIQQGLTPQFWNQDRQIECTQGANHV